MYFTQVYYANKSLATSAIGADNRGASDFLLAIDGFRRNDMAQTAF